VLLEYFWWGSVFLLAVPVMVLLLAVGPSLLPEYRDPNAGALHLPSAALSLAAVLALIFGLKEAAQAGMGWLPALSIAGGVLLAAVFVRMQGSIADPLIDLRMFRVPTFSAALGVYLLATFIGFGIFVFMIQYLQVVLGMSPLVAGLWTVPFALGFVVGSMVSPRLARAMHPAYVMTGGLALAAAGYLLLTQVSSTSGPGLLVAGMLIQSLGFAPVYTLTNDLIIGSAPPERAGAAAGISETASELGGALGIALLGSLATAIYGSALAPETLPQALEMTAWICAVLSVAMMGVILSVLRPVKAAA
jgi:DHA2 family multidrug resistance protein-like MFS transporter